MPEQEGYIPQEEIDGIENNHEDNPTESVNNNEKKNEPLKLTEEQEKLAEHFKYALYESRDEDAEEIFQSGRLPESAIHSAVDWVLAEFENFDSPATFRRIAMKLIGKYGASEQMLQSDAIQRVGQDKIRGLLSANNIALASYFINKFHLRDDIIKSPEIQYSAKWAIYFSFFEKNDLDYSKIMHDFRLGEDFIKLQETQDKVRPRIVRFLWLGEIDKAKHFIQAFKISNEDIAELSFQGYIDALARDNKKAAQEIVSEFGLNESGVLDKTLDVFGGQVDLTSYNFVKQMLRGEAPADELSYFGIHKQGEEGLNELRQWFSRFKERIVSPDFDGQEALDSPIVLSFFKNYVRYGESEWGDHEDESLLQTIKNYQALKHSGEISPLKEVYQPSGETLVERINTAARDEFEFSQDVKEKYGKTLRIAREASVSASEDGSPKLAEMYGTVNARIADAIASKREQLKKYEQEGNEGAVKSVNRALVGLEDISKSLGSIENVWTHFPELASVDDGKINDVLLEFLLWGALQKHPNWRAEVNGLSSEANFDDVSKMRELLDHITHKETWSNIIESLSTKERKSFNKAIRKIVGAKSFDEELARACNQDTIGKLPISFIPTRGLLMEFSGHISDACWASKYQSIARDFPNFTWVDFVQNQRTKDERIAGGTMLIETEAEDGTPLLVIRGFNPIENVINGLKVKDFFDRFSDYARDIADKEGRKLAVVIDAAGSASTNRPAVENYFTYGIKPRAQKVTLAKDSSTTFNGYDISDNVYSLDTEKAA